MIVQTELRRFNVRHILAVITLTAFLLMLVYGLFIEKMDVSVLSSDGEEVAKLEVGGGDLISRAVTHAISLKDGRLVEMAVKKDSGPDCPT